LTDVRIGELGATEFAKVVVGVALRMGEVIAAAPTAPAAARK
jgi:hypothetical protein